MRVIVTWKDPRPGAIDQEIHQFFRTFDEAMKYIVNRSKDAGWAFVAQTLVEPMPTTSREWPEEPT